MPADRPAPTAHPIHDLLRRRWSPRAFSSQPIARDQLATLFEAARWAPSSYNEQPWRFVVATSDAPAEFQRVLGCLIPFNQSWAKTAPVVGIACTALRFAKNGKDNAHARHDVGLALMALSVQAMAFDIYVHQMAGIDAAKAKTDLALPEGVEAVTGFALGRLGDPAALDPATREREHAPRERRALGESVFAGRFGAAADWAR